MPVVTEFPQGVFCWIELSTSDRKAATDFYTSLFGLSVEEVPMGEGEPYILLKKNGTNAAAIMKRQNDNVPPNWLSYVAVTDADAATEKIKSLGGQVIFGPFDVMDMGRMSYATDPTGAAFAIWQPKNSHPIIRDEANTLCWNELMTRDVAAAKSFYTSLIGWETKGSPEYTELHANGRGVGGMIDKLPEGAPPMWVPYFQVDDADAVVEKAKSQGASVFMGPMDFPHVGRFALLSDPQGAMFYVIKLEPR